MTDDDRTRPTRRPPPPIIPREDPFPTKPAPIPEKIARVALAAKPGLSEHEQVLRALEQGQRKHEEFEQKIKALIAQEVPKSLPPPAPPKRWNKPDASWLPHAAPILIALGALVTSITQSCSHVPPAVLDKLKKHDESIAALSSAVALKENASDALTKRQETYQYELDSRRWVAEIFEYFGVKVDDPAGTPPRDPMTFYPPPFKARRPASPHPVQPHEAYPVPPPP